MRIPNMATPQHYPEEECLNIYWKIKKISYFWNKIESPKFIMSDNEHYLKLIPQNLNMECRVYFYAGIQTACTRDCQISFLTCDGSQEKFSSMENSYYCLLNVPNHTIFEERRSAFIPDDTLTVRCRIRTDSDRGNLYLRSGIEVRHRNYLWILKDFTKVQRDVKKSIEDSANYGKINLKLKFSNEAHGGENSHIQTTGVRGDGCLCVFKLSALDIHGNSVNYASGEFIFHGCQMKVWSFPAAIKRSEFVACKDLLLPNDTLSLKCAFALSLGKVKDNDCVISFYENVKTPYEDPDDASTSFEKCFFTESVADLQGDLKNVLDNGTLCDASLQVGSEVIRVHKIMLSARSPVFMSMFTTDMKEAIDNTVVIPDLDVDTVRRLLLYIYTSALQDQQWEDILKLYVAADKYQVLCLKKECASFFKSNLSASNASEVLVLADMHHDAQLKTGVLDFIYENHSEVLASEDWKEVEKNHPSLAINVLHQIRTNKILIVLKRTHLDFGIP